MLYAILTYMKDILGWEGIYAVTEDGRVWAYPRVRVRKGTPLKYSGYWRNKTITRYGYVVTTLYKSKGGSTPKGTKVFVHRLVAQAYLPKVQGKEFVNHKDGDKQNNHISNLEWCTYKENTIHAFNLGLRKAPKGDGHGMSKMTVKTVGEARQLYKEGNHTKASLGRLYGVSKTTMGKIINGTEWKHVPM